MASGEWRVPQPATGNVASAAFGEVAVWAVVSLDSGDARRGEAFDSYGLWRGGGPTTALGSGSAMTAGAHMA